MVAASAGTDAPSVSAATIERVHLGVMSGSLLQAGGDVFGVLLVALKDLQAGLQQALQLRVGRIRNERRLQRAVDGLVVGDLVGDTGLVELRALELAEFSELAGSVLRQGLAGIVVLGRDLQLLDEVKR